MYDFKWTALSATGEIEGIYEQSIHGETLKEATEMFEDHHGTLQPDENGVMLRIDHISWSPEK